MNKSLTLALVIFAVVGTMTAALAWNHGATGYLPAGGTKVLGCHLPGGAVYFVQLDCIAGSVDYDLIVVGAGLPPQFCETPGPENFLLQTVNTGTYKFVIRAKPNPAGPVPGAHRFRIGGPQSGDPLGW
jgi:hypothetical protein